MEIILENEFGWKNTSLESDAMQLLLQTLGHHIGNWAATKTWWLILTGSGFCYKVRPPRQTSRLIPSGKLT